MVTDFSLVDFHDIVEMAKISTSIWRDGCVLETIRKIFRLFAVFTPCPGKNGTNNILGITLTKFNKFSQLLAQFMLTCQLTKKL